MILRGFILIASLASMAARPSWAQGTSYTFIEIGTRADSDFVGRSLNKQGHVAGRSGSTLGAGTRAFVWRGAGNIERLGSLDASSYSVATSINDLGVVAGAFNVATSIRAYIALPADTLQLLPNPLGDNASQAFAVNQTGDAAGYSSGPAGEHACLWSRGGVEKLAGLSGVRSSRALDMSDSGHIVGTVTHSGGTRAFLWTRATGMQDLGVLPGDYSSEAFAVNNAGEVVGYSRGSRGMRAFRWTRAGGMQDIGVLTGDKHSRALDISDSGEIIGTSIGPSGSRAFIWRSNDGMKDLNLLIPVNLGLRLLEAHAINARGQMVVIGADSGDGHSHEDINRVFLLTPAGR